jgi:hypothetical protein
VTPNPPGAPDAPLSLRLRARVGPELVASILSAAVIVLVIAMVLWLPRLSGIAALATPSATAGPTGPSSPGAPATATASAIIAPTATPEPNPATRAVLEIVDRLIAQRADLENELSKRRPSVQVLAEMLRDINTSLLLLAAPLGLLQADPAAADLATRITATKDATFEAVSRTQKASITNAKAYRDGAAQVVATVAPLVELRAELAVLAGGPASAAPASAAP